MKCIYDPLEELIKYFEKEEKSDIFKSDEKKISKISPIDKILIQHIVEGNKVNLEKDLVKALKIYTPLEIINEILLDGMKIVGELFGSGKMQLPFVLQSAECMKHSVEFLEQFIDKGNSATCKGVIILATVKGDVHDIGKNLVDIILSNNGYKVINLGIKCPLEKMVNAYIEYNADAIGMSGLLVKSTIVMKENLEILNKRNLKIPVILGGAALTRKFVDAELRKIYDGLVFYANDAFDGLRYMEDITSLKKENIQWENKDIIYKNKLNDNDRISLEEKETLKIKNNEIIKQRLNVEYDIPEPPFWGCKIIKDIPVEEVFNFVNEKVLFSGRWDFYKNRNISKEEYEKIINTIAKPKLQELKTITANEKIFFPKVIYGYYPCQSDGDDLIIYKPLSLIGDTLYTVWQNNSTAKFEPQELEEWKRINFPRQKEGRFLCISDYFKPKSSGILDFVTLQIVTIGEKATEYLNKLYNENKYQDYLYLHGLTVELAEALAEYSHKQIRKELNIDNNDILDFKNSLNQKYQGIRYSFGYPACPDLESIKILFDILKPERIGIELTEEFQMVPEQSTNAIILHRKDAKYFSIR